MNKVYVFSPCVDADQWIDSNVFKAVFINYSENVPTTFNGFSCQYDGMWLNIDEQLCNMLTDEDRLEITRHPTGNLSEPALIFPCTFVELKAFMKFCRYGKLDKKDKADLEAIKKFIVYQKYT